MDDFDMGLLDDQTYKVSVLRQKMLGIAPVFLYKIKSANAPIHADQWNLRKPLQQCSLRIERRGSILLIVFTFTPEDQRGSKLFAICRVTSPNIIDFVQPVEDSSRYFAVKVSDESQSREAWLGLGFREREEAQDFQQCLFNYQKAMMSQQ